MGSRRCCTDPAIGQPYGTTYGNDSKNNINNMLKVSEKSGKSDSGGVPYLSRLRRDSVGADF